MAVVAVVAAAASTHVVQVLELELVVVGAHDL